MFRLMRLALFALGKANIKRQLEERIGRYSRGAGWLAAAAVLALLMIVFLLIALWAFLAERMDNSAGAGLIVAALLLVMTGVCAAIGWAAFNRKAAPAISKSVVPMRNLPDLARAVAYRAPEVSGVLRRNMAEAVAGSIALGLLYGRSRAKNRSR